VLDRIRNLVRIANEAKWVGGEKGYPLANAIFAVLCHFVWQEEKNGWILYPVWETQDPEGHQGPEEVYYDIVDLIPLSASEERATAESLCIPVPLLSVETAVAIFKIAADFGEVVERGEHGRVFSENSDRLRELWRELFKDQSSPELLISSFVRVYLSYETAESVTEEIRRRAEELAP